MIQKFLHQSIHPRSLTWNLRMMLSKFDSSHFSRGKGFFQVKHVKLQGFLGILSYRLQGSIDPRVDIFQCTKAFHALHTWRDAGGDARDESHVQSSGVGMMRFLLNDSMPSRNFQLCNRKISKLFFCFSKFMEI